MSDTVTMTIGPKKEKGFCKKHGIEHAYEAGPTLTVNPPIQTRECTNCGHRQWLKPSSWEDAP